MNIHTMWDNVVAKTSFNGALANSTQAGTGVDTQGFRRAALYAHIFTGASTTAQITISDSPDNSVWTLVTGSTDPAVAIVASTADTAPYLVNIDLAKRQRYVRVNVVGTGTAGNAAVGFLLFEPLNAGVTNANAVISL